MNHPVIPNPATTTLPESPTQGYPQLMEHIEGRNHTNRRLSITRNIVACIFARSYEEYGIRRLPPMKKFSACSQDVPHPLQD